LEDSHFCRSCGAKREDRVPRLDSDAGAEPVGAPTEAMDDPAPASGGAPTGYDPPAHAYVAPHGQPPIGYGMQPVYAAPPQSQQDAGGTSGWLIGGAIAAVLALTGVGIAVYLAASSGSSQPARLLSTPALTTAAATASTPASAPTSQQSHSVSTPSPTSPSPSISVAHTATSTPAIARSSISDTGEQDAVEATIERHFALISQHQFSAAYALLAPSLQSGESSWIQSHRDENIYKVDVSVGATLHSSDDATATIHSMTTLDSDGCKRWSGSWGLTKIGGSWRISEANITPQSC
jgi:hypothetical protein